MTFMSCACERTSHLWNTLLRWVFTVLVEIPSRDAVAGTERPAYTCAATSASDSVNEYTSRRDSGEMRPSTSGQYSQSRNTRDGRQTLRLIWDRPSGAHSSSSACTGTSPHVVRRN